MRPFPDDDFPSARRDGDASDRSFLPYRALLVDRTPEIAPVDRLRREAYLRLAHTLRST